MSDGESFENMQVEDEPIKSVVVKKDRSRKFKSTIWHNFTIIDEHLKVASCDLCGLKMSYRSTVTNIRRHLIRKHNLYDKSDKPPKYFKPPTFKVKKDSVERIINVPKKKTLTELGGLDGLLLNVVNEEGDPLGEEESAQDEVVEEAVLYATDGDVHDYCVTDNELEQSDHPGDTVHREKRNVRPRIQDVRSQARPRAYETNENVKKNRIMDLQLECLEIKKYTMQMEALVLEHQLNLPRSAYTEKLERSSCVTRGTQTDIGGNNTKVFYVSDTDGTRLKSQHFFAFQSRLDESESERFGSSQTVNSVIQLEK